MKGAVYQRGKTWTYRFRSPQQDPSTGDYPWISKSGFLTKKEAWKACRDAMREVDTGRFIRPSTRTVAQFFDEWFAAVEPSLDATTWRNWKDYAHAYVLPRIGGDLLQRLDEPQLLKLYATLLTEGRVKRDQNHEMFQYWSARIAEGENPKPIDVAASCGTSVHAARAAVRRYKSGIVPKELTPGLAPKTVRNIHALLHRALVDAVAWKYLSYNPASNTKPPKRSRKRRTVWSPDQIRTFLASVPQDRFACGLKWSDVDLDAGEITIHDSRVVVGGHAQEKAGGKTRNADKTISIDRSTVGALRKWRELQNEEQEIFGADYHPGGYVFTFQDGRPPHPDTIRQRFDRLAAAAGLSRITFHDLRHSYATGALKAGVNPKLISERIGHADVGFFLQTYAHVIKNDDRGAAELAASFLIGDERDTRPEDEPR